MDKKKKLKHTGVTAKEESTMEKKMNHKSKSIQDILPLDLIHRILLRVPVRHLARLRCVSKRWYSIISDPHFAELHFHHSPASTNSSVFVEGGSVAYSVYLDSLFTDNNDALQVKKVSLPFKMKKPPSYFEFLGSCRGFVLLHRNPHFLVVWNPLTGSGKRISYSHIVSRCKYKGVSLPWFNLYGFGYDASLDDYLVVVAWQDKDDHYHFDCLSLRTNSWINLDAALPKPLGVSLCNSCGLFLNGAIHWLRYPLTDAIIIFDTKERTFSRISGPEQPVMSACTFPTLALLGGCLTLYYSSNDRCNTHIWVMKEYKVLSSWTLYQIPCKDFRPLCLSSNMDIIGRGYTLCGTIRYFIYNVREDLLKHFKDHYCSLQLRATDPVYTESLLSLSSDIKDKDKKKMKKNCDRVPSLTTAGLNASFKKRKRAEKQEGGVQVVQGSTRPKPIIMKRRKIEQGGTKEIEEGPKTYDERQKRLHGYPLEGGTSSPIDVGLVTEVGRVRIGQYLQVIGALLLSVGRTRELMATKENFELGEMRKLLKIKDELLNSSREELKKKDEEGKVLAEKVAALEKEKLVTQVKELESLLSAKEADVCEVFIQGFDRAVLQIKTLLPEADVSAMDVPKVAFNGELVDGEVLEEAVDENAVQQQDDEVVQV